LGCAAASAIQSCSNVYYLALTLPSLKASQTNNNNSCTTVIFMVPLMIISVFEIDDSGTMILTDMAKAQKRH
jgi:hypothetical protein